MAHTLKVHTLVIGSGAAGLASALALWRHGVRDLLIVTESLRGGTSINTGSDKQTYYKLSLCGGERDSVRDMAETYFAGGSMHGDLALAEAAGSVRAFMNLVGLGLPFPTDAFGQFVGYKTDHDPRQRATSIGPYTSREMCVRMIAEVRRLGIPVREQAFLQRLLVETLEPEKPEAPEKPETSAEPPVRRVHGADFYLPGGRQLRVRARNVVFAVGGPGGLYRTSVYPKVHTGAIGVALQAGALAQNLPESQFGLASTAFRWNVSGTYMQVVPRFISTAADGVSDVREFLEDRASRPGEWLPLVFLKGYQWPFDVRKTLTDTGFGSSMIDLWVYVETVVRSRRVFLDFRQNAAGYSPTSIGPEAREYLQKSRVLDLPTPLERLESMNPGAVRLYAENGIRLDREPLEIAVCAQHNNGGLAADADWQSLNIRGLFPVGEVNGSHGVSRPGGSALNAGQVGALRAAQCIARNASAETWDMPEVVDTPEVGNQPGVENVPPDSDPGWQGDRERLQDRTTRSGGFLRRRADMLAALEETRRQQRDTAVRGMESHRNAYLLATQRLYLDAIRFQLESGVGSRGSALVLPDDAALTDTHALRPEPEDTSFRGCVLESWLDDSGVPHHRWVPCRPLPEPDSWFENVWRGGQ